MLKAADAMSSTLADRVRKILYE